MFEPFTILAIAATFALAGTVKEDPRLRELRSTKERTDTMINQMRMGSRAFFNQQKQLEKEITERVRELKERDKVIGGTSDVGLADLIRTLPLGLLPGEKDAEIKRILSK